MNRHATTTGKAEKRGRRAASLIEFVFVMGLLFLLLFGIVEFGFMMSASMTVNAAAHQGARAVALNQDMASAVTNGLTGLVGERTATVEYAPAGSSAWSATKPQPLTNAHQVRVSIAYRYEPVTFVGASLAHSAHGMVLNGRAVVRYGG